MTPMVSSKNTRPMTIRTTGPAMDRGGRGGGGGVGAIGVKPVLATVHLLGCRLRIGRGRRRSGQTWFDMSRGTGASLKQFHAANHEKHRSDITERADIAEAVDEANDTDRSKNRGAHQTVCS